MGRHFIGGMICAHILDQLKSESHLKLPTLLHGMSPASVVITCGLNKESGLSVSTLNKHQSPIHAAYLLALIKV